MLKREVGVLGAMFMGLGSIVGTGVFISIGIGAGVTGPAVILAIIVGGLLATCNGLSSAQLAANHPVSGGTYEYGYRWLRPSLGFTAGWMFLCAKSASAATAALGFAGYALNLSQLDPQLLIPLAVGIVILTTLLVFCGIRRSNWVNIAIVSVTLLSLTAFIVTGLPTALANSERNLVPFFQPGSGRSSFSCFCEACALMFVAFTGYGRIATLGEEVVEPRKTIPRAIIATLIVSALLYILVGYVSVANVGSAGMSAATAEKAAPLEFVATSFKMPFVSTIVGIGAMTAMLGVLLNLILGLSRVALAMGRRGDFPPAFAKTNQAETTPYIAVVAVGGLIAGLALIGNVKATWSFSAFTVLIYYAITNLAATQLSEEERLYSRAIPWLGLTGCLFLAFWVEPTVWLVGIMLIVAGLLLHLRMRSQITRGE